MSYDISLSYEQSLCPTCGHDTTTDLSGYDWNYTSNINQMLNVAEFNLKPLDGKKASDCIAELTRVVKLMSECPETFKQFNPPNKWGSYDGILKLLCELLEACKAHPDSKVSVTY